MKITKMLLLLLLVGLLCIGCSGSAEESTLKAEYTPSPETEETFGKTTAQKQRKSKKKKSKAPKRKVKYQSEFSFKKLNRLVKKSLMSKHYPYVMDINVQLNSDRETMSLSACLSDAVKPKVALEFADTFVRQVGHFANILDERRFDSPEHNSYGGIFDRYQALVGIAPLSEIGDDSKWFVFEGLLSSYATEFELQSYYD